MNNNTQPSQQMNTLTHMRSSYRNEECDNDVCKHRNGKLGIGNQFSHGVNIIPTKNGLHRIKSEIQNYIEHKAEGLCIKKNPKAK